MDVQTITKYNEDGSIKYKETFNVFSIIDKGNGVARAAVSVSRKPNPQYRKDQALLQAGVNVDKRGYIHGNIYASFIGDSYKKVLGLKEGTVIEDVVFEIDPFPYVDNQGALIYRNEPVWMVKDFKVKEFENKTNTQQVTQAPNDPVSPMYQQKPQERVETTSAWTAQDELDY